MPDPHATQDRAAKKPALCWHCLNPVTNHIRGCVMDQKGKR